MSNNLRTRNGMPFNFVNGLKVRGMDIESLIPGIEGIPEAGSKYQFAGNGSNKVFTLPVTPYNKDAIEVHVKQLYVHSTDYTLVGDTVTLAEAPPAVVVGETYNVEIKVNLTVLNGYVNANRVSYEGENLDTVLAKSKPFANYSQLRTYAGAATQVRITDPGISGFFYYDPTDTTSADNGGTIIVSGTKRWKRLFDGMVNVKWFGAKGDGVSDDTPPIQAAVDYAIYFKTPSLAPYNVNQGSEVFVPAGKYRTTDTIQLGYGHNGFTSVILTGETSYANSQSTIISGIIPDFIDRPGINIQGGRRVKIRDIAITGKNHAWLYQFYSSIVDTSVISNWYGPNISAANNTQYAPYAGITIDAYSTARPATSYPNVNYPSWLGTIDQYNKNYSSTCTFENVTVQGFVVGIMQAPYAGTSGNGDFTSIKDCYLANNVVGFAGGNLDARNNNITNTRIHFCHTAIDGATYGGQNMLPNLIVTGSSFDNIYRLFNVETDNNQSSQAGQGLMFDGCYSEVMRTFGKAHTTRTSGTVTQAPGIAFNSCKWNFIYLAQEYVPVYVLDAPGTTVEFNNTIVQGGFRFFNFNCKLRGTGLYFDRGLDSFGVGEIQAARVASSYTTSFMAQETSELSVSVNSASYYDFGNSNINPKQVSTNGFPVFYKTDFYFTQRGLAIPWYVQFLQYGSARWSVSGFSDLLLDRATYNLSALTKTTAAAKYKNEYTFTVPDTFVSDAYGSSVEKAFAVNSGDVVIDDATGHVFFVAGITFSTGTVSFRIRQLTGIKNSGTTGSPIWESTGAFSATTGTLRFKNSRRYYPAIKRIVATMTTGSPTIAGAICGSETTSDSDVSANTLFLFVSTNDYVISSRRAQAPADSVFPYGKVISVDSTAGTITLSQNARRSYYGDVPLFVKGSVSGTAP